MGYAAAMAAEMGAERGRVAIVAGVGLGVATDSHRRRIEITPDRAKLMAQGAIAFVDKVRRAGDGQSHFAAMAGAGVGCGGHAGEDNGVAAPVQLHLDFSTVTPAKAGAYTHWCKKSLANACILSDTFEAYGSRPSPG